MATRVRDWPGGVIEQDTVRIGSGPEQHVTPAAIDEALEFVVKSYGLSDTAAGALRQLLSADYTSGVAQAYFSAMASRGLRMSRLTSLRKTMVVPYALDDTQTAALSAYAPDFRLQFRGTDSHDHPVYAAQRSIDQVVCESRMPPGASCTDIGGSTTHHSAMGDLGWHTCSPKVDRKDLSRHVLVNLTHRKRAGDGNLPQATREYSARYLAGDESIACGKVAQECSYPSFAATSVHVYDIPMGDWAGIMENKGLQLVEGCMLFTDRLFHEKTGVFPSAEIRYECDPAADKYSMGFVGSPSWWYTHSLREHLRYGADQVLVGARNVYSYKIVERRQDTIFFRIMRISGAASPDYNQVYRLPGVKMVEVSGPEISSVKLGKRDIVTWQWPEPLWDAMVNSAVQSLERGTYDVEQQFNKYRSIAPRQTINAVHVSGGYTVQLHQRVALVVYSSLEAVVQVARQQASFSAFMQTEMRSRMFDKSSLFARVVTSLMTFGHAAVNFFVLPLRRVVDWMGRRPLEGLEQLYTVAPRAVVRTVPADVLLWGIPLASTSDGLEERDVMMKRAALAVAPADIMLTAVNSVPVAEQLLGLYGDSLGVEYKDRLAKLTAVETSQSSTVVDTASVATAPKLDEDSRYVMNSVHEAIVETELEMENVEASCLKFRVECLRAGEPDVDIMKRKAEELMEPDFWWVSKGYVVRSAMGKAVEEFDVGGLMLPYKGANGKFVCPVTPIVWEGDSRGHRVMREYPTISDTSFEGWAFCNKSLVIYNGPEIVSSLLLALTKVHPFEVVLHQGPAGCGKTTTIVKSVKAGEMVLCPARASVEETRGRITRDRPELKFDVKSRCRTIDSYLVNYGVSQSVRELSCDTLRGDEAFMTRAGRWYACALLLGARYVEVYGDAQQIPHVPRALCPQAYLAVKPDSVDSVWLTYRCPWDALAAVGDLYGWRARSVSAVEDSLHVLPTVASRPLQKGHVLLCMYQDEKKQLQRMYSGVPVSYRVMTVHEAQGNTFQHVRLHRFVRGKNQTRIPDAYDLFQKNSYVLVAITRHTVTFEYFTEMGDDNVTDRITQGKHVGRKNAAGDAGTAGIPVEFV